MIVYYYIIVCRVSSVCVVFISHVVRLRDGVAVYCTYDMMVIKNPY
jgi:hypothetical protein